MTQTASMNIQEINQKNMVERCTEFLEKMGASEFPIPNKVTPLYLNQDFQISVCGEANKKGYRFHLRKFDRKNHTHETLISDVVPC